MLFRSSDVVHVPDRHGEYLDLIGSQLGRDAEPSWDMTATRLLFDQPRGFDLVASWRPLLLKGKFDQWQLPMPHRNLSATARLPWQPPPPDPREPPDDEELFAWIIAASSAQGA